MAKSDDAKPPKFPGFSRPNYTPVPDAVFDELLTELTGAELKVLLYICRRTFGFKKDSDNISLQQLMHGITTNDGRVLDRGTGLTKKTLLAAITNLEERGFIETERRRSAQKGDEATNYRLHFIEEKMTLPLGEKLRQGGGEETPPRPRGKKSPTQESVNRSVLRKKESEEEHLERLRRSVESVGRGFLPEEEG